MSRFTHTQTAACFAIALSWASLSSAGAAPQDTLPPLDTLEVPNEGTPLPQNDAQGATRDFLGKWSCVFAGDYCKQDFDWCGQVRSPVSVKVQYLQVSSSGQAAFHSVKGDWKINGRLADNQLAIKFHDWPHKGTWIFRGKIRRSTKQDSRCDVYNCPAGAGIPILELQGKYGEPHPRRDPEGLVHFEEVWGAYCVRDYGDSVIVGPLAHGNAPPPTFATPPPERTSRGGGGGGGGGRCKSAGEEITPPDGSEVCCSKLMAWGPPGVDSGWRCCANGATKWKGQDCH